MKPRFKIKGFLMLLILLGVSGFASITVAASDDLSINAGQTVNENGILNNQRFTIGTLFSSGTSVQVGTYEQFLAALLDDSVSEINLTQDIELKNNTPILAAGRNLTINGSNFTLSEANNLNARIILANDYALTINDLNIVGRSKFGTFSSGTVPIESNVTITYNNVQYSGPQLVYNPGGTVIFSGINSVTLKQVQGVSDEVQEVAELAQLEFVSGAKLSVRNDATEGTSYSAFWFRGAHQALTINRNVQLDIAYENAFALFYGLHDVPLMIGEGSVLQVQTKSMTYGSFAFTNISLSKGAQLNFVATDNEGSINSLADITLAEESSFTLQTNGQNASLFLGDNAAVHVGKNAIFDVGGVTGTGIFADEFNHKITMAASGSIQQWLADNTMQTWSKLQADIERTKTKTIVQTSEATINGQLNLNTTQHLRIGPELQPFFTSDRTEITYERTSTVSAQRLYADLGIHSDANITITSDFDPAMLMQVKDHSLILSIRNLDTGELSQQKVIMHVVDTIAPIIYVRTGAAQNGMTYTAPVAVLESAFLTDIEARTDDGSPITTNFASQINGNVPGTYEVRLDAVDAYGNHAHPVYIQVKVIINDSLDQDTANYVVLAENFVIQSSDIHQALQNNQFTNEILDRSQAVVLEKNSNQLSYNGLTVQVGAVEIAEMGDQETNSVVTHSGLADYRSSESNVTQLVAVAPTGSPGKSNNPISVQDASVILTIGGVVTALVVGSFIIYVKKSK